MHQLSKSERRLDRISRVVLTLAGMLWAVPVVLGMTSPGSISTWLIVALGVLSAACLVCAWLVPHSVRIKFASYFPFL